MNQHSFRQKQEKNWKFVLMSAKFKHITSENLLNNKVQRLPLKWGVTELSSMFGSPETSISNWVIFWQDFGQNCIKNADVSKKHAD